MNRQVNHSSRRNSYGLTALFVLMLATLGCQNMIRRGQSPDGTAMKFNGKLKETRYIGDIAAPWGLSFAKVEGIALVTQLKGTGSNPRPTGQREHLVAEMHSHKIQNINEYLAQKDNSLALVKGLIPPGAQKGDRFDLAVRVMDKSDTTSLEHGYLMQTRLRPMARLGTTVQEGHVVGLGRGSLVLLDLFDASAGDEGKLTAIVPGGGVVISPRPVGLAIQRESHSFKNATAISRAINERFSTLDVNARVGVANPKNDKMIEIKVPAEYRLNITRFFQVVRSLAYDEAASQQLDRVQLLEEQLNQPKSTQLAALRLEAIGRDAIPSLKRGLRSDDPEIRFHSAQALTYMGQSDGIEALESAAREEPAFRWHALTALASSDYRAAEEALVGLLDVPSAETRYGAFRALQKRSPNDPAYEGEFLGESFYLSTMPSEAPPLVHVAKRHRPEIVLFGKEQRVNEHLLYVESGLTVKAVTPDRVEITRFVPGNGGKTTTCSTELVPLIHKLTRMGCEYSSIVNLLKEAKRSEAMNGSLVVDALPKPGRSFQRKNASASEEEHNTRRYVMGGLPNLFRSGKDGLTRQSTKSDLSDDQSEETIQDDPDPGLSNKRKPWSIIPKFFRR